MIKPKPKSEAGWQSVQLPSWCTGTLRCRRSRPGNRWKAIFTSPAGLLCDPTKTQAHLRSAFARLGYPGLTSHTFRRTVGTPTDQAALSARAAADQLAHAKISMTQDYYFGRTLRVAGTVAVPEAVGRNESRRKVWVKGGRDPGQPSGQGSDLGGCSPEWTRTTNLRLEIDTYCHRLSSLVLLAQSTFRRPSVPCGPFCSRLLPSFGMDRAWIRSCAARYRQPAARDSRRAALGPRAGRHSCRAFDGGRLSRPPGLPTGGQGWDSALTDGWRRKGRSEDGRACPGVSRRSCQPGPINA